MRQRGWAAHHFLPTEAVRCCSRVGSAHLFVPPPRPCCSAAGVLGPRHCRAARPAPAGRRMLTSGSAWRLLWRGAQLAAALAPPPMTARPIDCMMRHGQGRVSGTAQERNDVGLQWPALSSLKDLKRKGVTRAQGTAVWTVEQDTNSSTVCQVCKLKTVTRIIYGLDPPLASEDCTLFNQFQSYSC